MLAGGYRNSYVNISGSAGGNASGPQFGSVPGEVIVATTTKTEETTHTGES